MIYTSVFIQLPKKGKPECSNHRPISPIVHASKILLKIMVGWMKQEYRMEIAKGQAGFVEGRGTREQIANIRMVIDKCRESSIPLYLSFILTMPNHLIGSITISCDTCFPQHLTSLLSQVYEGQQATARTTSGDTDPFEIGRS